MNKIGLFWGSNTGNQEEATNYITDYMKGEGCEVDLYNIAETPPVKMLEYEKLIIGCPTWHIGEFKMIGMLFMKNIKNWIFQEKLLLFLDAEIKLVMLKIFLMQ